MKKSIFLILLTAFFFSCQNNESVKDNITDTKQLNHETSNELSLNNNAKWKADSITNENVLNLKTIADNFRILPHPALNEYKILSNDLQKGLDKLVSQCKMSGPDHDALHKWLAPLMQNTSDLKKAPDTSSAAPIFHAIDERINAYNTYFK